MYIFKNFPILILLIGFSFSCYAQDSEHFPNGNHKFSKVIMGDVGYYNDKISYINDKYCSHIYASMNFCQKKNLDAYNQVLMSSAPTFNKHYILYRFEGSPYDINQHALVAIDTLTGNVYPFPFDVYMKGVVSGDNSKLVEKLSYAIDSNRVCVQGEILVDSEFYDGNFCFNFDDGKFTGYHTSYMKDN